MLSLISALMYLTCDFIVFALSDFNGKGMDRWDKFLVILYSAAAGFAIAKFAYGV